MTSVLNELAKMPRFVRILATNGIDENNAVVIDKKELKRIYDHDYYLLNRDRILAQKKLYNSLPEVKARSSQYHKEFRLKRKNKIK